jgi:hypothetical protein
MSCSSRALCVAIDYAGRIVSSTDPAASQPTWDVPSATALTSDYRFQLSCPTRSRCVGMAIPEATCFPCGYPDDTLVTSTSPGSGPQAWTISPSQVLSYVQGLSCPSSKLCVAVGSSVFTTTHPTVGASWKSIDVWRPLTEFGPGSVSCDAQPLCVIAEGDGYVLASTDPTGGPGKWQAAYVDQAAPTDDPLVSQASLTGVSCASGMLCAAVDNGGNVVTSINPTGGSRAWTTHNLKLGYSLSQIDCPSIQLCVGIDGNDGNMIWSTDPTGPASTWKVTTVDPGNILTSLSCPSGKLCVAGDDNGNVFVGTGPGPRGVARKAAVNDLARVLGQSCAREHLTAIRRRGGCPTPFTAPGAGLVTISWLGADGKVLATGQTVSTTRGRRTVHVALTNNGKRLLRRANRTELLMRATFEDATGHLYTRTTKVTLTR